MKLLRLLGNFWETHNWRYIFFERFWTYRSDDSDEGVCPKMGAVSTNLSGQNALNPWKFCYPTFGQACAYPGESKICAFSLLIYMQAKHVVAYLLDHGEGGPHIFSLLLRQHWRAMAAETHGFGHKVSHCRGLARHCRRGRGQETIFYDVFPFIPGMVPTPDHPRLIR